MPTVDITPISGTELYHRYPVETRAQPCFVELDARTGALTATHNGEIGNAVPEEVHLEHVLRWDIPAMKEGPANALLASIAPLAQRVVDGYSSSWDGNDTVGEYTDDANEARAEIEALCDAVDDGDRLVVWTAADLLGPLGTYEMQAHELGITAASTDEELDAIAAETADCSDEIDMIVGLADYLKKVRALAPAPRKVA